MKPMMIAFKEDRRNDEVTRHRSFGVHDPVKVFFVSYYSRAVFTMLRNPLAWTGLVPKSIPPDYTVISILHKQSSDNQNVSYA